MVLSVAKKCQTVHAKGDTHIGHTSHYSFGGMNAFIYDESIAANGDVHVDAEFLKIGVTDLLVVGFADLKIGATAHAV